MASKIFRHGRMLTYCFEWRRFGATLMVDSDWRFRAEISRPNLAALHVGPLRVIAYLKGV